MIPNEVPKIAEALTRNGGIEVAWLYGSHANGTADFSSDYDLALALAPTVADHESLVEDVRFMLSQQMAAPVSVVDVNRIPTPLALNVVSEGRVLVCKSDFRLRAEQQRVWSLWEEYKYEYEHNRQAL